MSKQKSPLRKKADLIKEFRCKNLIVVLENPKDLKNIGTVIRNVNALGAEKIYVIDEKNKLPNNWQEMREHTLLLKPSVSAIKWSFVKKFNTTESCIEHLNQKRFVSIVTSPHIKGKNNVELPNGKFTQKKLAVWFGNESQGVSKLAINNSEQCVNIPMFGIIESFNLGTSTGIVLYEITKQRRQFEEKKKKRLKDTNKSVK
jgi:tRNA (guanosine-2'-O-)-methyltransferase